MRVNEVDVLKKLMAVVCLLDNKGVICIPSHTLVGWRQS